MNTPPSVEVQVFLVRRKGQCEVALAQKTNSTPPHPWDSYRIRVGRGEVFEDAAVRMLGEQARIHVQESNLQRIAITEHAVNGHKPFLVTHVFLCHHWDGKPVKTSNMGYPSWFSRTKIPTTKITPGTNIVLAKILEGHKTRFQFSLDEKLLKVLTCRAASINNL